jgi:hypothetical protein
MADCVREIDNYDKGIPHSPIGRFSPTRLVIPYEANQQGGSQELLCLPDTVDPRGPKGK